MGNFLFENTTAIPRLTGVLRVRLSPVDDALAEPAGERGRACIERVVFHPAYIKRKPTKHPAPATGAMPRNTSEASRARRWHIMPPLL